MKKMKFNWVNAMDLLMNLFIQSKVMSAYKGTRMIVLSKSESSRVENRKRKPAVKHYDSRRKTIQSDRVLCSEPPMITLMLCSHCLKILNDFIYTCVLCM